MDAQAQNALVRQARENPLSVVAAGFSTLVFLLVSGTYVFPRARADAFTGSDGAAMEERIDVKRRADLLAAEVRIEERVVELLGNQEARATLERNEWRKSHEEHPHREAEIALGVIQTQLAELNRHVAELRADVKDLKESPR